MDSSDSVKPWIDYKLIELDLKEKSGQTQLDNPSPKPISSPFKSRTTT
jgi:hypothetical protein